MLLHQRRMSKCQLTISIKSATCEDNCIYPEKKDSLLNDTSVPYLPQITSNRSFRDKRCAHAFLFRVCVIPLFHCLILGLFSHEESPDLSRIPNISSLQHAQFVIEYLGTISNCIIAILSTENIGDTSIKY